MTQCKTFLIVYFIVFLYACSIIGTIVIWSDFKDHRIKKVSLSVFEMIKYYNITSGVNDVSISLEHGTLTLRYNSISIAIRYRIYESPIYFIWIFIIFLKNKLDPKDIWEISFILKACNEYKNNSKKI